MRAVLEKKSLGKALAVLNKVVEKTNADIPSTWFKLTAVQDSLVIQAMGSGVCLSVWVPADVEVDGEVCVEAGVFIKVVRTFKSKVIELWTDEDRFMITGEGMVQKLRVKPVKAFPVFPDCVYQYSLPASVLGDGIGKVGFAVGRNRNFTEDVLNNLYIDGKGKYLNIVGSDGYRLAVFKVNIPFNQKIYINYKALDILYELLKVGGEVRIGVVEEFPSVWTNIHTYRPFKATRRGLRASISPGSTLSPHNLSERLANALRAYFFGGFLSFPTWDKNKYSTPHGVVKGKKLDVCLYKITKSDTGFKDIKKFVCLSGDNFELAVQVFAEYDYPDYERVIPSGCYTLIEVYAEDLNKALNSFANYGVVVLELTESREGFKVRTMKNCGGEDLEAWVHGRVVGKDLTIAFKPKQLIQFLKGINHYIQIEFIDEQSPAVFVADKNYLFVVMPVLTEKEENSSLTSP
jgi:DNA polymerase III sliding clamp (beta) subunit (PCNA family)